mgnify:CR=1 FL=1
MKSNVTLTKSFNALLFLYLCYGLVLSYLFTPDDPKKVPWEEIFGTSPAWIMMLSAIVALVTYALRGALLLKRLWNDFLANVFALRQITYDEATAIILVISALSIS